MSLGDVQQCSLVSFLVKTKYLTYVVLGGERNIFQ